MAFSTEIKYNFPFLNDSWSPMRCHQKALLRPDWLPIYRALSSHLRSAPSPLTLCRVLFLTGARLRPDEPMKCWRSLQIGVKLLPRVLLHVAMNESFILFYVLASLFCPYESRHSSEQTASPWVSVVSCLLCLAVSAESSTWAVELSCCVVL